MSRESGALRSISPAAIAKLSPRSFSRSPGAIPSICVNWSSAPLPARPVVSQPSAGLAAITAVVSFGRVPAMVPASIDSACSPIDEAASSSKAFSSARTVKAAPPKSFIADRIVSARAAGSGNGAIPPIGFSARSPSASSNAPFSAASAMASGSSFAAYAVMTPVPPTSPVHFSKPASSARVPVAAAFSIAARSSSVSAMSAQPSPTDQADSEPPHSASLGRPASASDSSVTWSANASTGSVSVGTAPTAAL
ncbi:hypothetical protein ACFX43_26980 [Nocardioides sp. YIM B13467]|uniref:hypothetical protein n=1 Tax=Nocardioides sp. YIM B13467 TaxID=3366294 RepID=UPI00366F7E70